MAMNNGNISIRKCHFNEVINTELLLKFLLIASRKNKVCAT